MSQRGDEKQVVRVSMSRPNRDWGQRSPRLVIAGTHSGVGKTTLTVGIIAALRRRGLRVQPFKVGPDYIDPTYHTLAAGCPARNLDTWMIPRERVFYLFARAMENADLAVIEGVMGLYDGFGYEGEEGSTAEVAKLLAAPVVLVLDAFSMARSAAAVALGYQAFDRDLPLAGIIVNRVAGDSHGRGVAAAIQQATGLPVLGWLPRDLALEIPERHLGLIPTAEPGRWRDFIGAAADDMVRYLDLDRLVDIAQRVPSLDTLDPLHPPGPLHSGPRPPSRPHLTSGRPVIAVARDEAFNFIYEDNLDLLRSAGAEIAFFSPLRDISLPPGTAGVILSGGFPEVYAARLGANAAMRATLHEAHVQNMPIYAECGGLMYLTESIIDLEGNEHSMVGLLPGRSRMIDRLTMGYRVARAAGNSWLFAEGESVRGHEFHYSDWEGRPDNLPPAYILQSPRDRDQSHPEGASLGSLWASYLHLHFWTKPELAVRFVTACQKE